MQYMNQESRNNNKTTTKYKVHKMQYKQTKTNWLVVVKLIIRFVHKFFSW